MDTIYFLLSFLESLGHFQTLELMNFQPWNDREIFIIFLALTKLFKSSLIYLISKMVTPIVANQKRRGRKVTS